MRGWCVLPYKSVVEMKSVIRSCECNDFEVEAKLVRNALGGVKGI